jgi:hypothetical protein
MKRIFALAALILLAAIGTRAQTTTTFSITVQAPPSCTVTIAPNPNSTSGLSLRSGVAGVLNFNISTCSIASATATATWDGTSTPTTYVASPAALSVPISATQATVGNHSLVLTIPWPTLALNSPVTLPNGQAGTAYNMSLVQKAAVTGMSSSYSVSLKSGSLPPGLSLSSSGLVTGMPSGAGSSTFTYTVTDTSQLASLALHSKLLAV